MEPFSDLRHIQRAVDVGGDNVLSIPGQFCLRGSSNIFFHGFPERRQHILHDLCARHGRDDLKNIPLIPETFQMGDQPRIQRQPENVTVAAVDLIHDPHRLRSGKSEPEKIPRLGALPRVVIGNIRVAERGDERHPGGQRIKLIPLPENTFAGNGTDDLCRLDLRASRLIHVVLRTGLPFIHNLVGGGQRFKALNHLKTGLPNPHIFAFLTNCRLLSHFAY